MNFAVGMKTEILERIRYEKTFQIEQLSKCGWKTIDFALERAFRMGTLPWNIPSFPKEEGERRHKAIRESMESETLIA